jgi:hypothetical protein
MQLENEKILKKQLNTILNKTLTFIGMFLKKYEFQELRETINHFIYSHSIYKNRDRINSFANIIMNSNKSIENTA